MAPKKAGGKKKAKGPALDTSEEAVASFGFRIHEIIRTPLGLQGTVVGVKCEDPHDSSSARIWVRYANGHEAPLEPKQAAGHIGALGYRRCTEADHIKRDVAAQEAELLKLEEQRRVVQEVVRLKQQGLPIPDHLRPPVKQDEGGKCKKGSGDDKGVKPDAKKKKQGLAVG